MFKKAFTLAEVLLVIAVIGIVSALTIPNLANSYSDEHTVVKLKQIQNDLDSALQQTIQKYGPYEQWECSDVNTDSISEAEKITEFLDATRTTQTVSNTVLSSSYVKYILKDGTIIGFFKNKSGGYIQARVVFHGSKGTVFGKHVFEFLIRPEEGTVSPQGKGSDVGTNNSLSILLNSIYATNWAINVGNLDYLKCKDKLNWVTARTCP